MPDDKEPLTLPAILTYLAHYGGKVTIHNGSPAVTYPPGTPAEVKVRLLEDMRARRGELIDHYYRERKPPATERSRAKADRPTLSKSTGELPREERRRLLREAHAEAAAKSVPLWYLKRCGLCVKANSKPLKKNLGTKYHKRMTEIPIEREATHISVGGEGWRRLPKITTRKEDEMLAPAKKKQI